MYDITDSIELEYTYKKGEYSAKIYHIFLRSDSDMDMTGKVIIDSLDTSDHRPVQALIKCKSQENTVTQLKENTFHKFNWKSIEFQELYKKNVDISLKHNEFLKIANNVNFQVIIDDKLCKLTKCLIKCAR